ncbi:MAG: 16S rRNA (uracil(1498)-N(3))-methyltransferase, partial [Spirochaetia bacterium]|nr:16S rRNA (uracil(1498)-N(3))-methyltransferase [Spirochaetia bacterium]
MRQYLLPQTYRGEDSFYLEGKESLYLTKVLRLKVGQQILGRDTNGEVYQLTLIAKEKQGCLLSCKKQKTTALIQTTDSLPSYQGPYPKLVLLQCLCKGKKEEQIVRQATELGVSSIALIQSRYCVVDLSDKKEAALQTRFDRLESQIKEAIQQSGSPIPTSLEKTVIPLSELPRWWNNRGLAIFFHQSSRTKTQKTITQLLKTHPMDKSIAVLIGPEGGFSDE